ncbi:hypothetical protein [Piscinibacter sakaiensis]|uniref:Uncharacterized protein n=1 Tax=Piscinibacter sakaiensis TaxID=1547922 RepID=A0A0K8P198_PISS1|nr:hypothetical protein [Piscinibacter sakaiensis]GAP36406.1 hypothetical protein ISF6_2246 [Piscinibacter sakaiensis]
MPRAVRVPRAAIAHVARTRTHLRTHLRTQMRTQMRTHMRT